MSEFKKLNDNLTEIKKDNLSFKKFENDIILKIFLIDIKTKRILY